MSPVAPPAPRANRTRARVVTGDAGPIIIRAPRIIVDPEMVIKITQTGPFGDPLIMQLTNDDKKLLKYASVCVESLIRHYSFLSDVFYDSNDTVVKQKILDFKNEFTSMIDRNESISSKVKGYLHTLLDMLIQEILGQYPEFAKRKRHEASLGVTVGIAWSPYARIHYPPIVKRPTNAEHEMYKDVIGRVRYLLNMGDEAIEVTAPDELGSSGSDADYVSRARLMPKDYSWDSAPAGSIFVNIEYDQYCQEHIASIANQKDYPEPLKRTINKFKRICDRVVKKNNCNHSDFAMFIKMARRNYKQKASATPTTNAIHKHELYIIFNDYLRNKNIFRKPLKHWFVKYQGDEGIDAGGLRKQFFENVCSQITSLDILVETQSGTNRYMFNKDASCTIKTPTGEQQTYDKNDMCEFLGAFIAFCLVNGFSFNFQFSRLLLAGLLQDINDIDKDAIALYYLLEFPVEGQGLLKMMRDNTIDGVFDFSDIENLPNELVARLQTDGHANAVTTDNFRTYLKLKGRFNLIPDPDMLRAFHKGCFITVNFFAKYHITIPRLDALLFTSAITEDHRKEIVNQLIVNLTDSIERERKGLELLHYWGEHHPEKHQAFTMFAQIIRLGESKFIAVRESIPDEDMPTFTKDYQTFMSLLLFFWTSRKRFVEGTKYTIRIINSSNKLIQSHTCFDMLDIPTSFASLHEMYVALIKSIALSGNSFGVA